VSVRRASGAVIDTTSVSKQTRSVACRPESWTGGDMDLERHTITLLIDRPARPDSARFLAWP